MLYPSTWNYSGMNFPVGNMKVIFFVFILLFNRVCYSKDITNVGSNKEVLEENKILNEAEKATSNIPSTVFNHAINTDNKKDESTDKNENNEEITEKEESLTQENSTEDVDNREKQTNSTTEETEEIAKENLKDSTKDETKKETDKNKEETKKEDKKDENDTQKEEEKVATPEKPKDLQPYQEEYYSAFKSFMFSKNVISTIQKALELHNTRTSNKSTKQQEKDAEEKENGAEEEEDTNKEEEIKFEDNVSNVYLKAIAFISNNFWTVWINDKKISNVNNLSDDNEYVIKHVSTSEATVVLTVSKAKWNYINSNGTIGTDEYKINDSKNKVEFEFTLHPNQTFVLSKNTVVDGKYKGETEKQLIDSTENISLDSIINETFSFDGM